MPVFEPPAALNKRARLALLGALTSGCAASLFAGSQPTPLFKPFNVLLPDQYVRRSWQTEEGLPQNSVYAIAQTSDGYVWLGTEGGLARFDGLEFTTFETSNTPLLAKSEITALLVDRNQTLWVGMHGGGLICYRNNRFEPSPWKGRFAGETILSLHEDRRGGFWIGTEGSGLFRYSGGKLAQFGKAEGLPANSVLSIASDSANNVWIGTQHGLGRLPRGGSHIAAVPLRLSNDEVRSLYVNSKDRVWVGTRSGLASGGGASAEPLRPLTALNSYTVSAITEDHSHTLWVGSSDAGLGQLVDGKFRKLDKSTDISALLEDKAGTLWIGTSAGGLISLRQGVFTALTASQGLASDVSLATYQDRAGTMWIGSEGGLTRWASGVSTKFTNKEGLPDNLVFSITEDGSGTLWVGTRKGLARKEGQGFLPYNNGLPLPGAVMAAFTDFDGTLWVGSRGGIAHLQGTHWTAFSAEQGMPDRVITAIARDSHKHLWASTAGGGIFTINESTRRASPLTEHDGLPSNVVYSIFPDHDGSLWLGTNSGLAHFSDGRFNTLAKSGGLIDESVLGILDDQLGSLWLNTNRGIQRIRKDALASFFTSGKHQAVASQVFNLSDGMKSREGTGGFQPASCRTADGHLWFPTLKGVVSVDPAHALIPRVEFPPLLEAIISGGKSLPLQGPLIIPPGKRDVEFHFTAPGTGVPEKLNFFYQLEGFDHDWISVGTRRIGYYTNLPVGNFRFRIRACIYESCSGDKWSLVVAVKPAFYETGWFALLTALLVGGLAFGLHRMRVQQLRQNELKLIELVDERTLELRQSRDQLEVRVQERTQDLFTANRTLEAEVAVRKEAELAANAANIAKTEFLTNMSHEIRTPINGIMGMTSLMFSTELTEEQTEYLEIVGSSSDSLLRIVNDILDFSKIEARKLDLECVSFDLSETVEQIRRLISVRAAEKSLRFDVKVEPHLASQLMGDPGRLRQILVNLLENALKFTQEGCISLSVSTIQLTSDVCKLNFAVTDTGIGISKAKQDCIFDAFCQADYSSTRQYGGTGLGLTICNHLVQLMHGRMSVESIEGQGSTFSFTAEFPVCISPGISHYELQLKA